LIALIINAHSHSAWRSQRLEPQRSGIDLERPACFEIGPTSPAVKHGTTRITRDTFRGSCDPRGASRHDAGDCAARTGFTSRPSARSDLLFTMSETTQRCSRNARRQILPDEPMTA